MVDPLAGMIVSGMIMKEGISICTRSFHELTDKQVGKLVARALRTMSAAPSIASSNTYHANLNTPLRSLHHRTPYSNPGPDDVPQVSVDPTMSASVAQQVATRVRRSVVSEVPQVTEVLVHFTTLPPSQPSKRVAKHHALPNFGRQAQTAGEEQMISAGEQPRPLVLHDVSKAPLSPWHDRVMRPKREIEGEIKRALSGISEVWGCSHIHLFWDSLRGGAIVQVGTSLWSVWPRAQLISYRTWQVDVIMDPNLRVLQAMRIGGSAKRAIEQLED
ncbi:MAG: hypothetical protein SGPRY_003181, partial [Prymnesium sp.]